MNRVSVALAAYRGEKFIARQIESLLRQTRPPDEIVITDDSSDDATCAALAPFLTDSRIKYVRNPERIGVNGNFEKAITLCSGEYIFLCDQDDVWLPDKLRIMTECLDADPAADGVFCNSTVVDESLEPLGYSLWRMRGFDAGMKRRLAAGDALSVFLKRITLSTHNIAIRRRVLPWILPYPDLAPFYSDTWIALRIASQGRWTMVDAELTLYRVHGGNLSAPGLENLTDQARRSRENGTRSSRARTAELARELLRRLPATARSEVRSVLEKFLVHYEVRRDYPASALLRVIAVSRELLTGRYKRFSNGWRSAAADIFFLR